MRSTKVTVAALAFVLAAALGVSAAEPADPRMHSDVRYRRVNMQLQQLASNLELTAEQKTKIKPLIEARVDQMRALRVDESLDPEQKQIRMQALQHSYHEQIRALLSPDQVRKLDEMREKNRKASQETMTIKRKGKVGVEEDEN